MMTADVQITFDRLDTNVPVARLRGDLDTHAAREVSAHTAAELRTQHTGFILDLSGVDYIDSSGVRMLVRLGDSLEQRSMPLLLVCPEQSPLRRLLKITGLTATGVVHTNLADAILAAGGDARAN